MVKAVLTQNKEVIVNLENAICVAVDDCGTIYADFSLDAEDTEELGSYGPAEGLDVLQDMFASKANEYVMPVSCS